MKTCSICNQQYTDANLNFCLNDGGVLIAEQDDSPPTIRMNQVRTTQPNWSPPPPFESAPPWGSQPLQQQPPMQFAPTVYATPNQTLAVVSLSLGIASVTIGWCCSLGIVLSPAALITGFIALSQIKKDPQASGGKGMALAGIITGAFYLAIIVLFIMIYGIAFFFGTFK